MFFSSRKEALTWLSVLVSILCLSVFGVAKLFPERPPTPVAAAEIIQPAPVQVVATKPVIEVGDFADRVFYSGGGSREWGTLCKLGPGWVSVHHVTVNGTPVVGPTAQVTAYNEASDWSFLGIDPADLNADDFGRLTIGESVTIMGYPARDRDGEIIPAKVYLADPNPPFMWLELQPLEGGAPPEGVVGGVSGSCVLGDAQGKLDLSVATATALANIDPATIPQIEAGRFGLLTD